MVLPAIIHKLVDHNGKPLIESYQRDMSALNFKAASTSSNELAGWKPRIESADQLVKEKTAVEGRAWNLVFNNGYASGAVQSEKDAIVGAKYRLSAKPDWRLLGISHEDASEWSNQIESAFHLWADDPEGCVDAQRKLNFTQLLRLATATEFIHGEFMCSREWRPDVRSQFATCFQIVEPERVATPYDKKHKNIVSGVEVDRFGAATAYFVRKGHPADYKIGINNQHKYQRVTKYNAYGWRNFIHIFEPVKSGQRRGLSYFSSTIQKLKMMDRYEDMELEAAIMSATYAMVLESNFGANSIFDGVSPHHSVSDSVGQMLQAKIEHDQSNNISWNGIKIPHLFPGEQLKQIASSHPAKAFEGFESAMLRHIARGWGKSYEQLSGDYTKTTYSSARAAMIEAYRTVTSKRANTPDRLASVIYRLWLDEAISRKLVSLPRNVKDYWPNRQALSRCSWIGSGRGDIDELKAAKANEVKLRTGQTTLQKVAADAGEDWQENIEQAAREATAKIKALEAMGVEVTDQMKLQIFGVNSAGDTLVFGVGE